jgi:2-polyprenyl-3-methyl-5-hydroxy-6-metoxy-1,4-benzoquinol methylase
MPVSNTNIFSNNRLKNALDEAYKDLKPYSLKYGHDFKRYMYSLRIITGIKNIEVKRVVDIGTGIGIMPLTLKKIGINAVGVDRYIFPDAQNEMFKIEEVEDLQKIWKARDLIVYNLDIFDSNFHNIIGSSDLILSEATLEHLKSPQRFFGICADLNVSKGYLLVTTPNLSTLIKRLRFLFGKTPYWPIEEFFPAGGDFTGHWREYTRDELVYMFQSSGYEVIRCSTENIFGRFRNWRKWKKNLRALLSLISYPLKGSRDMHYILGRKNK